MAGGSDADAGLFPPSTLHREALTGLTVVTHDHFDKLVTVLEKGLDTALREYGGESGVGCLNGGGWGARDPSPALCGHSPLSMWRALRVASQARRRRRSRARVPYVTAERCPRVAEHDCVACMGSISRVRVCASARVSRAGGGRRLALQRRHLHRSSG